MKKRRANTRKSDGVAMIMVLVMVIIFASLILAVVISSSTAIRRAHYYKDKSIALQIAEAGLQEILFRMNYQNYDSGRYPFGDGVLTETKVYIPDFHPTDYALVKINNGTGTDTHLVSIGRYRGRTAQISVNLRGYASIGDSLTSITSGIPEEFNKKVIYAHSVAPAPLSAGVMLKGNITTSTPKPSPFPWSEATWTDTINTVNITGFGELADIISFKIDTYKFSLPTTPPPDPATDDIYSDTGFLYNSFYDGGVDVNTISNGVYWDEPNNTYYFGRSSDNSTPETYNSNFRKIRVNAEVIIPNNAGDVTINNYFNSTENITINNSITTAFNNNQFVIEVFTGNSLTLRDGVNITGDLLVKTDTPLQLRTHSITGSVACDNDITITALSTLRVGGYLCSNGNITSSSNTNLEVKGSIVSYSEEVKENIIQLNGSTVTIDATNSVYDAAILVYNTTFQDATHYSTGRVILSNPVNITLGENQKTAILVCSYDGIIDIGANLNLTYDTDPPNQFAVVNFSGGGIHTSEVRITANNFDMEGSIYSYKDIILNDNTQRITGLLIAGNQVYLGNNSTITYNSESFLKNPIVYKGFISGKRRYIPLPGSWEVKW